MADRKRADARRNFAQILEVAQEEVAADGAEASFEKIAREAGVGSATVHRHFPTREALLYSVFRHRIDGLCRLAAELADREDHREALLTFLQAVLDYCVEARGLAITLIHDDSEDEEGQSCSQELEAATLPLVRDAAHADIIRPDVAATDLLAMVVGIALATEKYRDPRGQAERLLTLAIHGSLQRPWEER